MNPGDTVIFCQFKSAGRYSTPRYQVGVVLEVAEDRILVVNHTDPKFLVYHTDNEWGNESVLPEDVVPFKKTVWEDIAWEQSKYIKAMENASSMWADWKGRSQ